MKNWFKNLGPGPLVAAAFIGPGTVTVCTLAGVQYNFTLLWALILSIVATIVLQEMAARLGLITQMGLTDNLRIQLKSNFLRPLVLLLVIAAIVLGNAAYEAGNISGGALGLETLINNTPVNPAQTNVNFYSLLLGSIAFILLFLGNYKILERALIVLVILMSVAFVITAFLTNPDWGQVISGLFILRFSETDSALMVVALIGTTVVPYNIFLHASLVNEKWDNPEDLKYARKDTYIAVILGGIVSICIVIAAAAIKSTNIQNASDLALSLEPLFGSMAKYFIGIGLFAAGITSAITAPLAAAYVVTGCLGRPSNFKGHLFRATWMSILLIGIILSTIGLKPIELIKFAQFANGLMLPVIGILLLWLMNQQSILGTHKNSTVQNILGTAIVLVTIGLGLKSILSVLGIL